MNTPSSKRDINKDIDMDDTMKAKVQQIPITCEGFKMFESSKRETAGKDEYLRWPGRGGRRGIF